MPTMLLLASLLLPVVALGQPPAAADDESPRRRVMVAFSGGSFLGVSAMNLTAGLKEFYGAPGESGVLVAEVGEGGPAEAAGIRVGDVITRVGDRDIETTGDLRRAVMASGAGEPVEVGFVRERSEAVVTATLGEREGHQWFSGEGFSDDVGREIRFHLDPEKIREQVLDGVESVDFERLRERFEDMEHMDAEQAAALRERMAELEDRLRELEDRLRERRE